MDISGILVHLPYPAINAYEATARLYRYLIGVVRRNAGFWKIYILTHHPFVSPTIFEGLTADELDMLAGLLYFQANEYKCVGRDFQPHLWRYTRLDELLRLAENVQPDYTLQVIMLSAITEGDASHVIESLTTLSLTSGVYSIVKALVEDAIAVGDQQYYATLADRIPPWILSVVLTPSHYIAMGDVLDAIPRHKTLRMLLLNKITALEEAEYFTSDILAIPTPDDRVIALQKLIMTLPPEDSRRYFEQWGIADAESLQELYTP